MSADQMLWHCNQVLLSSLGEVKLPRRRPPIPYPVIKFVLLRMPWPHGAPTAPEYQPALVHDFGAERERCLALVDRVASRPLDGAGWGNAIFGPLSGPEWSRLNAKHLDHHLRQFGA